MDRTLNFERPKTFASTRGSSRLLFAPAIVLAFSVCVSTPAWATGSVLSGMFDGSEPVIAPLAIDPQSATKECASAPSGYLQSTFEVSATGAYRFHDELGDMRYFGNVGQVDVTAQVYEGSFDASHPRQNLIASGGFYYAVSDVNLSADTLYVLVVQLQCSPAEEGAWVVTFVGPGSVSSDHVVSVPAFTLGAFADDDPSIDSSYYWDGWGGGYGRYQQLGPIQVSRDGAHYFNGLNGAGQCLLVYTAPFKPNDLYANFVAGADSFGIIQLESGQDYYFVIQECHGDNSDEYLFVLAPPAPFRINQGLSDSWYNPETPGQGFFLDVFEQRNEVFLGWFTYATDPAADDVDGHRWMTAFGKFEGSSADLAIEWTAGGAFDATHPVPEQHVDGSIQLEFNDCTSGQITYGWGLDGSGAGAVSGVIPIQRNANDAVALCESLYAGPGTPGPL